MEPSIRFQCGSTTTPSLRQALVGWVELDSDLNLVLVEGKWETAQSTTKPPSQATNGGKLIAHQP